MGKHDEGVGKGQEPSQPPKQLVIAQTLSNWRSESGATHES
jgi:hypothetical protein